MVKPTAPVTPNFPYLIPDDVSVPQEELRAPRVGSNYTLVTALLEPSSLPKNARFMNSNPHQYNLRSKVHTIPDDQVAQSIFNYNNTINHIYTSEGKKETVDLLINGKNKHIWLQSLSNEWGRLAQGNNEGVKGTDTIDFIYQNQVPTDRDVTYATFVCDYRPLKQEAYRIRITVGGDKLSYDKDAGSPAANLLETKILLNSTISDANKGARFMSLDIKDHFLATPMRDPEYMRVPFKYFPQDIIDKYNLDLKVSATGYIYIEIKKGMPGLKQAALLAYEHLKNSLAPYGYYPIPGTAGLWEHKSRPTKFCLCVDDFGVKYWSKEDKEHLCNSIGANFRFTINYEGKNYCGLTLDWQYKLGYVDISMPKFVPAALKRLMYIPKVSPQYSPHKHVPIHYGKQHQYAPSNDHPKLDAKGRKHIQSIVRSFLYHARALDYTLLPAINETSTTQANPTTFTEEEYQQILDYVATYPNVFVWYYASDMVLMLDSDAAYLVLPNAKSRIAGYFYLSDHPSKTITPSLNGAIMVVCKALKNVVSSAAESETAGIFINAQLAIPIRYILDRLNHPQPPTPIKTDNSTSYGFVHNNINQKRSKSWDMWYHWLREKQTKNEFNIIWDKGTNNHADYFTKHHPAKHHLHVRNTLKYMRDRSPPEKMILSAIASTFPCDLACEGVL